MLEGLHEKLLGNVGNAVGAVLPQVPAYADPVWHLFVVAGSACHVVAALGWAHAV